MVRQGAGCNCDPSAVEEGWRGILAMRRRQAPRGFVREQKGPYAVLSVAGFLLGALVAAGIAGLVLALRKRRRAADFQRPSAHPHPGHRLTVAASGALQRSRRCKFASR